MISHSLPLVPLSDIVTPVERLEVPTPGKVYRQLGVRLWGEGAYERESIDGSQTQYKTLSRTEVNDIVVNKIWARNGSVTVIPPNLAGCYVSSEFPTFIPISKKLEPRWFYWFTKTKLCWQQCDQKSQGTSGKNRIRPEKFLEIEIPLPPLEEQRRVVARVEELAGKIEEVRSLRQQAAKEAEALLQAARRRFIGEIPYVGWIPLSKYVKEIENGWSPSCDSRPATSQEWGVLKVGAVSFGAFDQHENKSLPTTLKPKLQYEVRPGDFLMSRANTLELVGACAVVEKTRPMLMLSDKIFRFIFNKDASINPRYLDHVLKSPALREQIQKSASGTSPTMKNISKEKVLRLLIPSHDIVEQQRIVAYLDRLQTKVEEMKRMREQAIKELDALLPSILDKAFKGEL